MQLSDFNKLATEEAAAALLRCCGSSRWARQMTERRPFHTMNQLTDAADRTWQSLPPEDWLEAFAAHPRIGAEHSEIAGTARESAAWAAAEQSGMHGAADKIRVRLAEANRQYEARFGFTFIICATGRSAAEMLDALERRLSHAPDAELAVAAEEQRKITSIRLANLLNSGAR
jgi:2-oxo-4-hydroxy-4-carboxy-5-ureidoimidazoline decarboxylase